MFRFRPLAAAVLMLAGACHAQSQQALSRDATRPFPALTLPASGLAGERALQALGDRLPEVAAWYGMSPQDLADRLRSDSRARLDGQGRVFFAEAPPTLAAPAGSTTASITLIDGSLAPMDQTFRLHSRAGARKTLYLNFRGADLSATAWRLAAPVPAFDLDGSPGSFSDMELQRIQYIWQRVAEDYAPFDVDVTTEAPAADALARRSTRDAVYGATAVITARAGRMDGCGCGGISYLGVFDMTTELYKTSLVFHDALLNDEKYIAEALSHELGHQLGLWHAGAWGLEYYTGQGSGNTGWAPIMGLGYYQPVVQWTRGDYTGASHPQDEVAAMQGYGLALRADDHGSSVNTATAMTVVTGSSSANASARGVIERPDDIDMFSVTAPAGPVTVEVLPAARAANLDALLTLRSRDGTVLGVANPDDALGATLSAVLPTSGTYYVSVQSTGHGDATTGYPTYGSLGQYQVRASWAK
jgi:hypothetical protein